MSEPRHVVGIDLGTTHCALASSPVDAPAVRLLQIPQLVAAGEVAGRTLLPSYLYLPAEGELSPSDLNLPWGPVSEVVGTLALRLGAKVPGRLVASAKSWVCHGGVNRRAPILPWTAPEDTPHVSPFQAEVAYLAHLRAAWEARHQGLSLADQEVVVTVPASFDEGAREITLDAAREAGLGPVRLLEEPQAAFYDFLGVHSEDLGERLGTAKLILVVDVGGGTTDLTLLRVLPEDEQGSGEAPLERIAVGGHLMLGGDNMDAALAQFARQKTGIDRELDPTEWSALVQSARNAKERLLGADAPSETTIAMQSRGSRLVAGTRSITITREEAETVLLDGFLPQTGPAETAERAARTGLTTFGLPYASDPAIPRHLCSFLRRHVEAAEAAGGEIHDGLPKPDLLLLNGGVFNAPAIVQRLSRALAGWYGTEVPLLEHTSLDTAVARGAARYGLARLGLGAVIGGGTARAYYIGIESADGRRQAMCIAPRAMEEGANLEIRDQVFELVLDQPVAFPLYTYTGARVDPPGAIVDVSEELDPLPPLETILRSKGETLRATEGRVPVTLSATLDERGELEVYLVTVELPPRRWRLEFALASAAPKAETPDREAPPEQPPTKPHPGAEQAAARIRETFAAKDERQVRGLRRDVEKIVGPRGQWSAATCRALWEACMDGQGERGKTAMHELNWLRLTGWCLRPGFGAPGDEQRLDRMWAIHDEGLQRRSKANWAEWWILWRRVAAGFDRQRQQALFDDVRPWLSPDEAPPQGPKAHGQIEMLKLLATLERLPQAHKQTAGAWFLAQADKVGSYWVLGRLGARALFHGETSDVVEPATAERWLQHLLELDWNETEGAAFAAASIARVTGDPARDIDAGLREQVANRLQDLKVPATWRDMVMRSSDLSEGDMGRVFGESLPVGLRLKGSGDRPPS